MFREKKIHILFIFFTSINYQIKLYLTKKFNLLIIFRPILLKN